MSSSLTGIYGPSMAMSAGPGATDTPKQQGVFKQPHAQSGKDSVTFSGHGAKEKKGLIGSLLDVGKGFVQGGINTVKGLFSLQGLAMSAGTFALIMAFGAATVMPFLIAAGVVVGGSQIIGGLLNSDWRKVGEGIFTMGATGLGAKYGPKEIDTSDGAFSVAKITQNGGVAKANKPTGMLDSIVAYLKAPFRGLGKVNEQGEISLNAEGKFAESKSVFSAAGDRFQTGYDSLKQTFGGTKGDAPKTASASEAETAKQSSKTRPEAEYEPTADALGEVDNNSSGSPPKNKAGDGMNSALGVQSALTGTMMGGGKPE